MSRGCIFCDRTPTTRAHIFRKEWLDNVMPGSEPFVHHHVREPEFNKTWPHREADLKVKCACNPCNSGWMDRLDHAAEDLFLTAAVAGHSQRLDREEDRHKLARWCALVAALFDQTQARPILSAESHKDIYEDRIPADTHLWLACTTPPGNIAWGFPTTLTLRLGGDLRDAYLVTFGVQQFVAQAVIPADGTVLDGVYIDRGLNMPLLKILWPSPLTPLVWPPRERLSWEDVPDFARSFINA